MSDFGIICEFNPLHGGHQYLIEQARAMGAERVVCIMSGNSVQRGSLAVTDSYTRAECALRAGADLVLELPFPWCSASAEGFAMGGISVARHFCDRVIFGSERGDLPLLRRAARIAEEESFRQQFNALLRDGAPAAKTYYALLEQKTGAPLSSNDLLGLEYLRAARRLSAELDFLSVKRQGSAYGATELTEGVYPSATAIRSLWKNGGFEQTVSYLPPACADIYRAAFAEGRIACEEGPESGILAWFRLHEGEDFDGIEGTEGGLAHRFCSVARESATLTEFYEGIRTKRYTDSHVRRVLLYCLTGVRRGDLEGLPVYTTLLAANEKGRALLSQRRKENGFPVITKPADAPRKTVQYRLGNRLDALFSLSTEERTGTDAMIRKSPFIL